MTRDDMLDCLRYNLEDLKLARGSDYSGVEAIEMAIKTLEAQSEIVRCKDCKFYSPMNKETKTGICNLTMHQNFGDDWFCAGAERSMIHAAPTIEPEPHWIPCSERLPDGKGYVLVTDYGETNIGRRFCGKWWLDYCGDKMKDVTAWMPLPEPYKKEDEA